VIALSITALALVLIAWIGYPIGATLLAWLLRSRSRSAAHPTARSVSVVLATRHPPIVVAARVRDLLATEYPRTLLEIIVAVDATATDGLADYAALLPRGVKVVAGDPPGGKAVTLNAAVRAATADLVVFADSAQRFDAATIPAFVQFLEQEEFGAVSGAYRIGPETTGAVLRAFWGLETVIRRAEARLHSLVAVTGAIYVIRRRLWRPLPAGLICDDLYVPLQVAATGLRVGFCETALASDDRTFDHRQEFARKVRTLTGLLQVCRWFPWVLAPWRNPVWLQFVCHKLLRLATPYLLVIAVVGAVPVWAGWVAALWPVAAVLLALVTMVAVARPVHTQRILAKATWAIWLQAAAIVATLNGLRGRWDVWQHVPPSPERSLTIARA
jgi:cellulose synthase/poly-beta-1,6-N-acetylglucosamine synthase-like glycosyltransferase